MSLDKEDILRKQRDDAMFELSKAQKKHREQIISLHKQIDLLREASNPIILNDDNYYWFGLLTEIEACLDALGRDTNDYGSGEGALSSIKFVISMLKANERFLKRAFENGKKQ